MRPCSPSLTSDGGITTSVSKKETNGRLPSKPIKGYLNHFSCIFALPTPPVPLKQDLILTGDIIGHLIDIPIATPDDEVLHQKITWQVLKVLKEHNLYLRPEKCVFRVHHIEYLSVILEKGQVRMDPIKVQGIRDWPTPTTVKEVQAFLGFTNYYQRFVPNLQQSPSCDLTIITPF